MVGALRGCELLTTNTPAMGAEKKRNSMETSNNLFIASTSIGLVSAPRSGAVFDGKQSRFYHLVRAAIARRGSIEDLARSLVRLCERAYGRRDIEALREASQVLCNLPSQGAREAGRYYQAIIAKRAGNVDAAQAALESLTDSISLAIRARSLHTLATIEECKGDDEQAARLHLIAAKLPDRFTAASVLLQLSSIRSNAGDHPGALHTLEQAWPLVRLAASQHSHLWPLYCNERAFELLQVGRLEEAAKYSEIATRSSIASAYPEWAETGQEIKAAHAAPRTIAVSVSAPISADEETEEIQPSLFLSHAQ